MSLDPAWDVQRPPDMSPAEFVIGVTLIWAPELPEMRAVDLRALVVRVAAALSAQGLLA